MMLFGKGSRGTVTLLEKIEQAFSSRDMPSRVTAAGVPLTDEYTDAIAFQGRNWREISCADMDMHQAAIFGFSPEAFRYFLPGICSAGIRENRPDLMVNSSLILMLDRGNAPSSWDDFFTDRWAGLSRSECEALQIWVLWLADYDLLSIASSALTRAYDTLQLLANQRDATVAASWSAGKSGKK